MIADGLGEPQVSVRAAANVWARLVHLEEGDAKAEAAFALADTYQKLGHPEEAIPWPSSVLSHVPDHRAMQSRLAPLYTAAGNPTVSRGWRRWPGIATGSCKP